MQSSDNLLYTIWMFVHAQQMWCRDLGLFHGLIVHLHRNGSIWDMACKKLTDNFSKPTIKKMSTQQQQTKKKKVKIMKDIPAKGIVFVSEDQCFFSSSAFLYLLESLMSTFIKTQTYTHQFPKREYRTDENKNTHTRMTTAWVFVACWPALRTHTNKHMHIERITETFE